MKPCYLGKNDDFWCSRFEYSCISDAQVSRKNDKATKDLSEFVWFENRERQNHHVPFRENVAWNAYSPFIGNLNLVWFEEGNKKLKETFKTLGRNLKLSDERITESQDQQWRKILETNPNLFR